MRRLLGMIGLLLPVLAIGCASSFEEAKHAGMHDRGLLGATPTPSPYCRSLDSSHRIWGGLAKGSAVLAGGAGLATIPVYSEAAEQSLAIASASMAAVTAAAIYFAEDASGSWARDCQ